MQKIIELSRDHIVLFDARGKLIYTNAVEPLLGYAPADYLHLDPQSIIHPVDKAKAQAFWQAVYALPNVTNTAELRYRHHRGHYIHVEVTATNLLDDPEVCAVVAYHRRAPDCPLEQQQTQHEQAEEIIGIMRHIPLGSVPLNHDISEQKNATHLLQAKHAAELEHQKQLQVLHEVSIELTLTADLDAFYKQVVQLGLTRLGFERMALFLYDATQNSVQGTYGTNAEGQLCSEKHLRFTLEPFGGLWKAMQTPSRFYLEEETALYSELATVGRGWNARVALWHGNQNLGWLVADNLLSHAPITPSQLEILAQYGMYIAASLARKQAEAALRASEEKFRRLLEAAPIAILLADQHGQITLINERAEALFGYSHNELIGQPLARFVPTVLAHHPLEQLPPHRRTVSGAQGHSQELYAQRKDGSTFPIEVEQSYVQTQAGALLLSFVLDITERKQVADALEEQRTFLRKVIDVSPSMIFVKDYNGRFVLVNPRVAEMYNVTVADLLGKGDADFNPSAEEVAHFLEADRRVIASGEPLFLEEPLTNPNGETRWLQTTKVPIVSVDGKSKYVLGVATDITERRQAEEALRHSEKLLRAVIENLPVGVWLLNLSGMITQTNPAGEQIWQGVHDVGLEELANVYKAWWADTGQPLRSEEWADVRALTQGETTLNQELEIEAFDGVHKYILSSAIPIRDAQQKVQGAIVVNQDITERKQNEKLIRQALEKEKELGELKSRFVSMASHEFRTPLATILALTDTLAAYWPKLTEEQIQQRFDKIKTQIAHLKSIMEDVLQLARIQAKRVEFQPVPLNLDELCRKIIDEFQVQLKLEQQIEYQCVDAALYTIQADPKLLRQIINNLLSNAIKYSPNGKPIRVNLAYAEQKLILAVRDQGIGIPKADLTHLFEPFHRAGNVGAISGTGLGMVITKEAVELHGGSISVASEIGVGSTFTVSLPIPQPMADMSLK
ncbi:MAG: PAS domain S-box protein [Caldilineaceae bacterium]